ncbi:MAG: hypothetical protein DRJ10_01195 [Bacteroidetes bacterium]|nr:MAG: hypothetical protein DRJ10_01195 [Bacteroidota bacterium]
MKTFSKEEIQKINDHRKSRCGCGLSKEDFVIKARIACEGTIDYALPHLWVKYMEEKYNVDYAKIAGPTVMLYNEENRMGIPVSYDSDIQAILDEELKA